MEKQEKKSFGTGYRHPLQITVFSALLGAISIVLGKYLAFNAGEFLRFSFENLPVMLGAIAFGPIVGAVIGTLADLLGSLMVGYAINPIITLGAATVGFVGGGVFMLLKRSKLPLGLRIVIAEIAAHLIGSVLIKSIGLYAMYGVSYPVLLLWRTLNYAIVSALEITVLIILTRNRAIMKILNEAKKKSGESFKSYANSFQAVTVPGLERIGELCRLLGNPQDSLKIIHIAGTNGKGSTCANLASILTDAGYRVGKYISPNLIRVNERISIGGQDISDGALATLLDRIEPLCPAVEKATGLAPTQFEIWTAAAFLYFAEEGCDYVVLEVGLGGELDATNVIGKCELSVITRLGLDHTQYLGNTLAEVAAAKAGIVKPTQTKKLLITVEQAEEALEVLKDKAQAAGCMLSVAKPTHVGTEGAYEVFSISGIEGIKCGISGYHQIENAALAALAAIELGISEEHIRSGIQKARNPARFELLSENPTVIYDGGHNENGIEALIASLDRYYPNEKKTVVFACMRDKDIKRSLEMLSQGDTEFIFTTVKDNPRADTAEGVLKRAREYGFDGVAYEEIGDAYKDATSRGRLTVICGSLYLYKDLCEYLGRMI